MTKNLDNEGLRSIIHNYDIFYIDLWGVIHNGITLHQKAIETLKRRDILEFKNQKAECFVCLSSIGDISEKELESLKDEER